MKFADAIARPSGDKGCPTCYGRQYLTLAQGFLARAELCSCQSACARCGGKGHLLVQQEQTFSQKVGPKTYDVLAPCNCQLLPKRLSRYNEANIPGAIAHATFDNFRPGSSLQERAREVVATFARGFRRGGNARGFILSGPVGAGKTHLLSAAMSHLILEAGASARYVEISLLYSEIRRGFQEGKSGGEIIGPLSEIEVLAIDELGKGRGSPFELETMDELIARRYNAGRTTLFATNYSLAYERKGPAPSKDYRTTEDFKALGRESQLLQDRVGERIYSRLCEMCEFVEMPDAPDHRHTQHERRAPRAGKLPRGKS